MSIKKLILIALLGASIIGMVSCKTVANKDLDEIVEETDRGLQLIESEEATERINKVHVRSIRDVYDEMHKMANTKIVANAIWGRKKITEERVNALILEVMSSDFRDKDYLLEVLARWKTGDFSHAVSEHNYFWDGLDGTVGRATELLPEVKASILMND